MDQNSLKDKVVLVTGGTGSFGKAFIKRILRQEPAKVIVFSRDEFKQSEMAHELAIDYDGAKVQDGRVRYMLGDIRDLPRLKRVFGGVDVVIHAAALKQVPALEYNPTEAILTNVNGAKNIVDAAIDCNVPKVIALSTDKAVNPVNLYGATKLCMEKIFTAANSYNKTRFSSVRYGNVIGSRGSVIPRFLELKRQGVTEFPITHIDMTRFWLTLDQAVQLVLDAYSCMEGGEIFVPRIPSMSICDMATAICPDCTIREIGIRPGEKMHEILVSEDCGNVYHIENGRTVPAKPNYRSDTNDLWLTGSRLREILNVT